MAKLHTGLLEGIGIGLTLIFILTRLFLPVPLPTPTEACGFTEADLHPDEAADVVLTVWAQAVATSCWRAFVPLLAARQMNNRHIGLELNPVNYADRIAYTALLHQAVERGHPPSLANMYLWHIDDLVRKDALWPVDECINRHAEFKQIMPELWSLLEMDGQVWGIPTQFGLLLFFFNKPLLRTLGWSEEQVDTLPQRIADGQFTLEDLVETIRHAVATGIVEPDFAYWPIYTKLRHFWPVYKAYGGQRMNAQGQVVIDQHALQQTYAFHALILNEGWHMPRAAGNDNLGAWPTGALWRETVANGRVLFWTGMMSQWTNWTEQAEIVDEAKWLEENIGVALYPGAEGRNGQSFLNEMGAMVMFRDGMATERERDAACRLLAQSVTPELSRHLTIQENMLSALEISQNSALLKGLPYHQQVADTPNYIDWVDYDIASPDHFYQTIEYYLLQVEMKTLTAEQAVDQAVAKLESDLGDAFIARP